MEDVRRFELVSKSSGLCIKTIKITPLLTVLSESIHSRTLFFNFVLKCFPSANTIQTTDTFLDEVNPTTLERPVQFHVIYESEEPVKLPLEQLTNYNGEVESIINLTSTVSIESLEILPSNKQYVIDLSLFTALKCIELHTSKDDHSDLALTTDCLEQCIERSIHLIIIHNQPTHLLDDSINKFNPSIIHCISSKVTPIPLSYSHLPITHSCPYKIYNDFKSNLPLLTKLYCPYTYTGEPNEFLQHINSLSKIYLIRETPKTKVYNSYNLPTSLTKLNIDTTVKNPFPMNYTELTNLKTLKLTDYASKYSLPTTLKVLTIKRLRGVITIPPNLQILNIFKVDGKKIHYNKMLDVIALDHIPADSSFPTSVTQMSFDYLDNVLKPKYLTKLTVEFADDLNTSLLPFSIIDLELWNVTTADLTRCTQLHKLFINVTVSDDKVDVSNIKVANTVKHLIINVSNDCSDVDRVEARKTIRSHFSNIKSLELTGEITY